MRMRTTLTLCLALISPLATLAQLAKFEDPRWEPIADDVYLQALLSQRFLIGLCKWL